MSSDKLLHFGACAIAAAAAVAFGAVFHLFAAAAVVGFVVALALGVGKEFGDANAPSNHWCWYDLAADALGAAVGALAGAALACWLA